MEKLNVLEAEELALFLLGKEEDYYENGENFLEDDLLEECNVDLDTLAVLAGKLLSMATVAKSPLTEDWYVGFADKEKNMWVIKRKIDQ